jgi:RsiW-degrading membrane proteinase PrsW (M82 family)
MIIIAWLLALRSGFWVSQDPILTPLLLPVINILAVGLPVLFFVRISLRGLNLPSARRAWSVFGASMVVSPFLAFIVESIAVLGIIILLFAISSFIPGLQVVIKQVLAASRTGIFDEEILARNLSNLLLTPPMAITALGTFSFLVPLIEETFKTILIWPLLSRLRCPSDGFVLGILCGAAFALTENIGFVSTGSFDWAGTVVSRTTAVLPHILNSGIMGWALVSAWTEKRYLRLGLSFLSVVLLHGAWNATSLGLAMNDLAANVSDAPLLLKFSFPWYSAWIILTLGSFGGLIFSNIQIRKIQFREQV